MIPKEYLENYLSGAIEKITNAHGENEMYFDDPIKIKSTPHTHVFTIYGAKVKDGKCYLMDGGGEWHGPLEASQANAEYVITGLYQRLKSMFYESADR